MVWVSQLPLPSRTTLYGIRRGEAPWAGGDNPPAAPGYETTQSAPGGRREDIAGPPGGPHRSISTDQRYHASGGGGSAAAAASRAATSSALLRVASRATASASLEPQAAESLRPPLSTFQS
jgi:hypothetical protein